MPPGVTLLDLLRDGQLDSAGHDALDHPTQVTPYTRTRLRAPIPTPPTVRDFMTFEKHVEGTIRLLDPKASVPSEWYAAPAFYFTNPYAILGPLDDVPVAPGSALFDLELEVAAVVGRAGRDVPPDEADQHIAGYVILNDWSARDIQAREMGVRLGPSKGKDTATTIGPCLVTPDELEPWRTGNSFDLRMTAAVNETVIGTDSLASMHFSFAEMVAHASRGTEVRPGDILGSGTCGGGCLAEMWGRQGPEAHKPLAPGDTVTVSVDQLGSLTTRIVEYPA